MGKGCGIVVWTVGILAVAAFAGFAIKIGLLYLH